MEDPDTLYIIIENRSLYDNISFCSVNKMFHEITKLISLQQLNKLYYFKKFKRRTFFQKKKKPRGTYYTLKNMYINKEEEPILFF